MRALRIIAGVFVFAVAILIVLTPESAPPLPASVFVFLTGLTLVVTGLSWTIMRANTANTSPQIPTVEEPAALSLPGSDADEQLETLAAGPPSPAARKNWVETREQFRSRLRTLAVATLVDQHGLSETAANAALDTGVWTPDPHAAAFFTDDYQGSVSLRTRLHEGFAFSKPLVGLQAERAIDELRAHVWGDSSLRREELVATLETSDDATAERERP